MEESKAFIPVGFTFRPSEQQLIEYYLFRKICGLPIPCVDAIVKECDLYGPQEPWEIWETCGGRVFNYDGDLYFFTELKKKTPKGSRICRKVGSGAWQGEDAANDIVSQRQDQLVIGSKKRFRYENKGSKENGCWIMHEYTIHPSFLLGQKIVNNYVLCRIRKNQPSGKDKKSFAFAKKRKLEDVQSSEPEMCLIPHDHYQQQILYQSEAPMVMTVPEQEASCSSNMLSESESTIIQRQENGEIDNSMPAVVAAMAVPYQNSSDQFWGAERFLIPQVQNQQQQMICLSNQSEEIDQMVKIPEQEVTSGTIEMMMSDQSLSKEPVVDVAVAVPYQKSSNQSSIPEMFLIPEENQQQIICLSNQSEEIDRMMKMLEQEVTSGTTEMLMSDQNLSKEPVADFAVAVPHHNRSNQSSIPEMFLFPQENQQKMIWVNNVGSCQSEDTIVTVLERKASCNADMMMLNEQDLSYPPLDSKNNILQSRETGVIDVTMLPSDQQEDDPLASISDKQFALFHKIFTETEYQVPVAVPEETTETLQQKYYPDSPLSLHFDDNVFFSTDELLQ